MLRCLNLRFFAYPAFKLTGNVDMCYTFQRMNNNSFPLPVSYDAKVSVLSGAYFFEELVKSIEASQSKILSVQYQWKWNIHERHSKVQRLGDAILRARLRGVAVSVVLNMESPNRNLSIINRVTGDVLARAGCNIKMLKTSGIVHTKLWLIDGVTSFVGSHNVSGRSFSVNEEVSVKIESKEVSYFLQQYFENLMKS